ncbi:hypothetical protein P153DRAFT_154199 [Dothidotthia symphoricarpi CBS 119687]|uniref:Uncharacterized protein n=1 Tax=Dothidotthia symphoricarpi CBS 119687 TaxID=1392245 RepID=A0A6A6AQS9_9PLEO|nr:uncharacterized protein P153DRAFT_154199 [Dothidotthia symphoricarpi CBS 119687]KAF2133314.1 hypothetical protein P153DRAFT_154199 [Dothidotthia symphoricarpi CBS 119687]
MAKRKPAATVDADNTFDSGFFSDDIQPPETKRRPRAYATKAPRRVSKQSIKVVTDEHRLATPAQGGSWRKIRSPLRDPAYEEARREQLHSPSIRLGRRSDHDVNARLSSIGKSPVVQRRLLAVEKSCSSQDSMPFNQKFLGDYKRARVGSEDGVPSREKIVALLNKYPSVNDQSLITTLLQDVVNLKDDLEEAKESNRSLKQENRILMEMAEEV